MHLINFLYKVDGKSELIINEENISKLTLSDLLTLMKAEQDGKIKIIIKPNKTEGRRQKPPDKL